MFNSQSTEILDLLKNQALLSHLNEQQLLRISKLLKIQDYSAGEIILKEGEQSHHLYMILDGEVEILKWDDEYKNQFVIGQFYHGNAFGEMSFVDKEPRSSTVKATKNTRLLKLDQENFERDDPELKAIYNKVISNILNINTKRIRSTNKSYVQSLKSECDQLKTRNEFAKAFVIILICFGVNNFFNLLSFTYHFSDQTLIYNWSYIFLFLIPIIIFMIKDRISPQTFGVTFKNTEKSLQEGFIISVGMIIIFIAVLFFYGKITHTYWPTLLQSVKNTYTDPTIILYFLHVYAQEFIARGALQTSVQRFFNDKKGYAAVIVASFIFFVFHLHLGISFATITFISSIFFGLIYLRHRNLLGVTLIHFVLGTFGKVFNLF
jgi:membrane protease YdiL (CAAX protease family)